MFMKGSTTHCLVVPAQSTLRSSAQSGAGDILVSSSSENRPILALFSKVQAMIADMYTVNEIGAYTIDESKIPPECRLPGHTETRNPSPGAGVGPGVGPGPLTVDQGATDRSQNATESANHVTAAVEFPGPPGTLKDADITDDSQKIAGSPVSVQEIWPFIQQIANAVWEGGCQCNMTLEGEAMFRLSTMTLAEIQASRPDYLISTLTTTDDAPDKEAQLGRDIVREEVNRALAGAVATLAGLLNREVGGAT